MTSALKRRRNQAARSISIDSGQPMESDSRQGCRAARRLSVAIVLCLGMEIFVSATPTKEQCGSSHPLASVEHFV